VYSAIPFACRWRQARIGYRAYGKSRPQCQTRPVRAPSPQWLRRVPPFEPDERGFKLTAHRGHIGLCLLARDRNDQRQDFAKLVDLATQRGKFALFLGSQDVESAAPLKLAQQRFGPDLVQHSRDMAGPRSMKCIIMQ